MTVSTENNQHRQFLNRRIAAKEEELAKVEADLDEATTQELELKLTRKAERLVKEIQRIYAELSELDKNNSNLNVRHLNLEKSFQKIDFSDARKITQSINTKFADESGAILFFLQRSTKQKGDYCLKEVLDLITYDRKIGDNISGDFRPYPVDLGSQISEFHQDEFVKRLASHLGDESNLNLSSVINKLCLSLRGGSTVFIEIKNWDNVIEHQIFLNWFITKFWCPLVDELNHVFQEYGKIRLIIALIAKSKILPSGLDLSDCFCTMDTFDHRKIIELPLPDWTVEDIKNWLINFQGLSNVDSQKKANQIHLESEGTPSDICRILEREFKK